MSNCWADSSGVATVVHVFTLPRPNSEFFGGVGWDWRYTIYLLWTHHENAFVQCRLYMHIWLLGASPPDPTGALPLDPAGGLPSPKQSVPTLPPHPGYATGLQYPFYGFYLFINIQWLDVEMASLISCLPIPAKIPALLAKTYRFATIQNITDIDDRQTDDTEYQQHDQ